MPQLLDKIQQLPNQLLASQGTSENFTVVLDRDMLDELDALDVN
jgi:hypothetical protein